MKENKCLALHRTAEGHNYNYLRNNESEIF